MKAFTPVNLKDKHEGMIKQARYNGNGRMYATAGEDGQIKLWDGVNSSCIRTIPNAHGSGKEVIGQF